MGRPPLPLGTWGEIRVYPVGASTAKGKPGRYRAVVYYRDFDGRTRQVERRGKSATAARSTLATALKERSGAGVPGVLGPASPFDKAASLWLEKLDRHVDEGRRSPGTAQTYRYQLDAYIRPALGAVRLGEITTPLLDAFIGRIRDEVGTATARTCRSIVSGVMNLAVRYGARTTNPAREVDRVERRSRKAPRALTREECVAWLARLEADQRAVDKDLPDLCRFLLATGVRIGEALAMLWAEVDTDAGVVAITSTIMRIKGVGLIRKTTKSAAGQRALWLPSWATDMLRCRFVANPHRDAPVFPDTLGGFRDPNNVRRDLRNARGSEEFVWVTPHNFRKTAATILDDAGLSARLIADQLGQAHPSMTQDVYLGRTASNVRAAAILEEALRAGSDESHG